MHADRDAITAAIRDRADLLSVAQEATNNGLRRMGENFRGPCPIHHGVGPNFSVSPTKGLYYCFKCESSGDVFDFVRQVYGLDFNGARVFLAQRTGVPLDAPDLAVKLVGVPVPRPPRPLSPREMQRAEHEATLAALRAEGCSTSTPDVLYGAILSRLTLEPMGAGFLASRAIAPGDAAAYGFRSVPDAEAWEALATELRDEFLDAEIALAGLDRLPWGGRVRALVLPYWSAGVVVGLRFRSLLPDADKSRRYWSLAGAQPPVPFNVDAMDEGSDTLHFVEGELNAWVLRSYGLRAVGLPGANSWRPEWAPRIAHAVGETGQLVAWYDDDAAGATARANLVKRLSDGLGPEWLDRHARSATLRGGDANDFHRAGSLRAMLHNAGLLV